MINFRYHIVSLMAVFIALSVGIAVGVSLSPSVDQGIIAQAAQDRKQVQICGPSSIDATHWTRSRTTGS